MGKDREKDREKDKEREKDNERDKEKERDNLNDKEKDGIHLIVTVCQNVTISDIVCGTYVPFSINHSKAVYQKVEKARGLDVLIYYWDDRDGSDLSGWWFGPSLGGDQVWAYHPSRT